SAKYDAAPSVSPRGARGPRAGRGPGDAFEPAWVCAVGGGGNYDVWLGPNGAGTGRGGNGPDAPWSDSLAGHGDRGWTTILAYHAGRGVWGPRTGRGPGGGARRRRCC